MTKKKERLHWMPWDIPAYWADTRGFTAEHHGAYMMLLGELWMRKGDLRADDPMLAALACCTPERWEAIGPVILSKFTVVDGRLTQKRLGEEFDHAQVVSAKRREAGKAGAVGKWGGKPDGKPMANAMANGMANAEQNDGHKHKQKQSPNGDSSTAAKAAPPPAAPPPPPPPAPEPKADRGTRLPKDWELPDEWRTWAEAERGDLNILLTADAFRDFWVAKSGKDATKLDWQATWRNWVRNQRRAGGVASPTRQDQRAQTLNGLGTPNPGANHGTNRTEPIDVQARVIPDA